MSNTSNYSDSTDSSTPELPKVTVRITVPVDQEYVTIIVPPEEKEDSKCQ